MNLQMSSFTRSRSYVLDINTARRQLKLALSIVTLIAVSVVSAAVTLGAHPIDAKRDVVALPLQTTLHAETNASGAVRS